MLLNGVFLSRSILTYFTYLFIIFIINYQAWHLLACFNFSAILFYKQQAAKLNQRSATTTARVSLPLTPHSAPDLLLSGLLPVPETNIVIAPPPVLPIMQPVSPSPINTSQSQVYICEFLFFHWKHSFFSNVQNAFDLMPTDNLIQMYVVPAVQYFFRSIALCKTNSVQDTLR